MGVLSKDAQSYCYYTMEAAVLLSRHVAFKTAMLYEKAILFNIGQYLENKRRENKSIALSCASKVLILHSFTFPRKCMLTFQF